LSEADLKKSDLNEIKVATGPGSYTGLRVGVAVANALAFALGIPVNGKETETDLIYE
jgi:tRNA threonylcarbamoyladenosine biosynthesis protein TsaB